MFNKLKKITSLVTLFIGLCLTSNICAQVVKTKTINYCTWDRWELEWSKITPDVADLIFDLDQGFIELKTIRFTILSSEKVTVNSKGEEHRTWEVKDEFGSKYTIDVQNSNSGYNHLVSDNHDEERLDIRVEFYYPNFLSSAEKANLKEDTKTQSEVIQPTANQSYSTVTIGTQKWMTKNLNVDKFRNGDPIPHAKTNEEWKKAGENSQPAWCYYNNDPANAEKYGKLYNWYAVSDPRGLGPKGFHIPTDDEWTTLINFLGGEKLAEKKMRSTRGWKSYTDTESKTCPNCISWSSEYRKKVPCHTCKDSRRVTTKVVTHSGNGDNSSGFSGFPGGSREAIGRFESVLGEGGYYGNWWSSTEFNTIPSYGWFRKLCYNECTSRRGYDNKASGFSVRCLMD